jgi:hypothetical protein
MSISGCWRQQVSGRCEVREEAHLSRNLYALDVSQPDHLIIDSLTLITPVCAVDCRLEFGSYVVRTQPAIIIVAAEK